MWAILCDKSKPNLLRQNGFSQGINQRLALYTGLPNPLSQCGARYR
jgi:hypothetical protein